MWLDGHQSETSIAKLHQGFLYWLCITGYQGYCKSDYKGYHKADQVLYNGGYHGYLRVLHKGCYNGYGKATVHSMLTRLL